MPSRIPTILPALILMLARLHIHAAEERPLTLDLYGLGVSTHILREDNRTYNERNWGAGIGVSSRLSEHWEATGMVLAFQNSYSYRSAALAAGMRYGIGSPDGAHASLAAMAGVVQYRHNYPVVLPVAAMGYKWANIESTVLPGPHAVAIAAWVRISIPVN